MECEIRESSRDKAGRVVSREKKACGRIIYGLYLADKIFLRQEEIPQLNTLFSWKLCTGN